MMQSAGGPPSSATAARSGLRDRLIASDPGGTRFRMALGALISVGSALALEFGFVRLAAPSQSAIVPMLVGAVVAMMGSMGLTAPTAGERLRTGIYFPVAFGLGMFVAILVDGNRYTALTVFVVVIFAAAYVRRYGPAFFHYGFLGWMGYFFGLFLHPTFAMFPFLLAAAALATAWVLLLSVTVLRGRPARVMRHVLRAFAGRTDAVGRAAADLLATAPDDMEALPRRRARLRSRQLRLAETALIVEGWLGDPAALPSGRSASASRRRLIDSQAAVDAFAVSADALVGADPQLVAAAGRVAGRLGRGDHAGTATEARALLDLARRAAAGDTPGWWPAQRLATTAIDIVELARPWCDQPAGDTGSGEREPFTPAVTLVMGGMLPGSVATAADVAPRTHRLNPLRRLDLTTRQALQMAVAGGLAILLGELVSPTRYYWAVLAAFLAFTGTTTRSETVAKAFNRVLGTLVGLVAAILLADLTAGNTPAIVVVILVSVFLAFYLFTVHYALMVFFVTIMIAEMYDVLHQFSDQLLLLRLAETAVGAAIGIVVALVLVPTSTRDTALAARTAVLGALAELLGATARRIHPDADQRPGPGDDTPSDLGELARTLDDRLRQLVLVARPLTWRLVLSNDPGQVRDRLRLYEDCGISARSLTMWLRRHPEAAPPELAGAAQALADAARRLTEVGTHLPDREVHEHLSRADSELLQATRPGAASAAHPATRSLVRLHELIHEVAAGAPADAIKPASRPAPPRPAATPGHADAALVGGVRVPDGEPVPAGTVTVIDGGGVQAGHADIGPDGGFRVPGRLSGPHVLVASAPGYTSSAVRLQLDGNAPQRVDLVLHPAPRQPAPRRSMRSGQCAGPARHGSGRAAVD